MDDQWRAEIESMVNTHSEHINRLNDARVDLVTDKQLAALGDVQEKFVTSGMNYSNLVIAAGYAGFFAFWSRSAGKIAEPLYSISGLLITTSLVLFIGWEVTKMIWQALHMRKIEKLMVGKSGEHAVQLFLQAHKTFQKKIALVWIFILVPTVLTGIGAGLTMIYSFGVNLWKAVFG